MVGNEEYWGVWKQIISTDHTEAFYDCFNRNYELSTLFLWESSFLLPQMLLGAELCEFGTVLSGVSTFPILFSQILECALWFSRWSRKIFEGIMGFYNFIYLFLQYYGCNIDENTGGKCLDRYQFLDKTWNKIYFSA